MIDKFESNVLGLSSPPVQAEAITPSDTVDFQYVSRCINTATNGIVRITTLTGDTVSLYIAAGVVFPIRATRVWATGTTATGIVVMS